MLGSGTRSTFIESLNRNAFVNFSGYLGYPRKVYFVFFVCFLRTPPTPHKIKAKSDVMLGQSSKKDNTAETNLNYNSKSMPRVKSAKKTVPVHNNLKAAKFQAKKSAAETNLVSIDITFTSNSTSTKL